MKILLLEEWMSTPKDTILDIVSHKANDLINRGVAIQVAEDMESPSINGKALEAPMKDKMLRRKEIK